ncbi:MAG TPA: imidazolonepropionase [Acidimicrobiales bacterium]|nr:imidazolonepropionase [Acidimicrobiales bacterium]
MPGAVGSVLFRGIGELVTNDPGAGAGPLGAIADAALLVATGRVVWTGRDAAAPEGAGDAVVEVEGRSVVPGFVDSHTHMVFAGERSTEFAARMAGRPYAAGGIATTVAATRAATDGELAAGFGRLAAEAVRAGTTTIECKSGYGLDTGHEARLLRIARRATEETTFLGAHVVPSEFAGRADDYVALVVGPMLEACAPLARWVDVFCERGAFDADQAAAVLAAGVARGLGARVHANQLGPGPGVRVAVAAGAASADHCTHLTGADVELLAGGTTVATLLPACDFSTRSPYPDARRLLDAGATVALATDCNPGTSYTTSMALCIALAVRELYMTPDEALWAATLGGARALRRDDVGHLSPGARADLAVLDAPSHVHLAYRPGVPLVWGTWKDGVRA